MQSLCVSFICLFANICCCFFGGFLFVCLFVFWGGFFFFLFLFSLFPLSLFSSLCWFDFWSLLVVIVIVVVVCIPSITIPQNGYFCTFYHNPAEWLLLYLLS